MIWIFFISTAMAAENPYFQIQHPMEIYENNLGARKMQEKSLRDSQMHFLEALRIDPSATAPRLNMGLTFEAQKEWEKAVKEYDAALKNPDISEDHQFYAHFNAGRVLQEMGKKDEALQRYQQALGVRPDSLEAKANIELLMQDGGGGGNGENQDQQQDPNNPQQNPGGQPNNENQDQQQDRSQGLTQKDIEQILEELKNQEQKIRAQEYGSGAREDRNGKDW